MIVQRFEESSITEYKIGIGVKKEIFYQISTQDISNFPICSFSFMFWSQQQNFSDQIFDSGHWLI